MSIVKRFNRLLGLEKIDVLVDEKDKSRHIIISDMPESLPQGKSSFLIEVSPYMRKGIELQIDFIDAKGNSIYVEPVSNYLEGTSRTVSVEVYNTVAPGVATMIIVGELEGLPINAGNYSEVEQIPDEFKGVYNVRLTKEVIINPAETNIQPIKFYSSPRLTAVEKRFGSMEREVVSGETTSSTFSIIGTPTQQEPFSVFTPSESEVDALGGGVKEIDETPKPPDGDIKGDEADKERLKRFSKKRSVRSDSRFKRSKRIRRRRSPEEYPYTFTIKDSNHEFTTEEIGGEIKFSNIVNIYDSQQLDEAGLDSSVSFNVVSDTNDENFPTHYTASIAKLENNKTAYVNTPFTKQDKFGNYRLLPMEATAKVHYTKQPSASYSITNIVSYADVTLSHLRTFSGELFKAKVYVRAEGSFDDYKLLAEVPIESPELMINNNSVGIGERTGYFISDTDLNTYWEKFGGTNGLSVADSTATASFDNSGMLDSVMISGSISSFTDQIRFQQKDAYKFNLTKNIDYDLSFKAVGEKGTDGRALLMIYVSGSSVKQESDLHFDEVVQKDVDEPSQYGKRMGVLEVEAGDTTKKEFGLIRHNFNPNLTGDAKVQFRVISGKWNISDVSVVPATDTGFSPSFVNFKQELPPELTHKRPETLEFLTEFYDVNNNLADEIAVTTGSVFTGGNMVITGDDNILEHNLFIGGDTTGSGIHMGGTSSTLPDDNYSDGATGSGFIRSIGYLGFESASNAALGGKKGFMIYSGSVLPNSGENYSGVGLELVGASGSLKFRTNPSVFDVQAESFFVGKTNTQFISGSGEKIEISSSNFHLSASGDVNMTGTITAESGEIGGFTINDGSLTAGSGNGAVTMSSTDKIIAIGSGSTFNKGDMTGGFRVGIDTDGIFKFAVGSAASYIHADETGVSIKSDSFDVTASVAEIDVDVFKLSANNLFISSSGGGFISAGNPRPTGITGTNKGFYVQGNTGVFLAGNAAGPRLSFDGTNVFMSSSGFFLGGNSQFVSGSDGNIEISSSNFHLDNSGNVIMTGKITANEGSIGGFNITNDALSSTNFLISGSATGNQFFISSSNFNVKASGDVTASALDLTGGAVGGLIVTEGEIAVGSILRLKDSGQITGSSVLFTGGKIGGFTIDADEIKSTNVLIDSANEKITLGSANAIKLQGGSTDNFIAMGSKSTFANEGTGTAGIIIGMDGTNPQAEFVKDASNYFIFDDGIDIKTDTLTASGSSIVLESPRFFLGKTTTNFISGSNGNIEISSSQFHLTREGNVTGSAILLGDKGTGQFLQFVNDTLTVQGAITADSIAVPSAATTPSSSITADGLLTTVSASIGGFDIISSEIKDKDENLRLKSNGQITGSKVLFNGGTIGGFTIDADEIKSGTNIALDSANKRLTINNATFGNAGIQLEYNSGTPRFYVGDGSNEFVKYDGSSVDIRTKKLNASGSNITLETPTFFLGRKSNQFVSGSNGNVEISSSNFHLTADGDVTMSGEITAAGGTIGGFTIGDDLSNSAGSTLKLKGSSGQITASAAQITGDITANTITANTAGTIGNFSINSVGIKSSNSNLILSASGQITASDAKITGDITANTITANTAGTIANFDINSVGIKSSNSNLVLSASGQITASDALLDGTINVTGTGTIAGWTIASNRFNSSDNNFRITSTGAITIKNHSFGQSGFQVIENGGTTQFYVGTGTNKFIKFDGSNVDIGTERLTASGSSINLGAPSFRLGSATNFISGSGGTLVIQNSGTTTISGSAVTIETPKFFFGQNDNQFVSGSNGNIEISSSKFHVKPDGDVIMNNITASNANVSGKMTATSGEIGGFTIGDDLSNSAGSTLKLKGSSGQITASAAQITGKITAQEGTIGGFNIGTDLTNSGGSTLNLKGSTGQITASAAQITGKITATSGQIAGFTIDGNTLTATNFTLDASGKRITLGTGNNIFIADGDEGIQLGNSTFASAPFSVTRAGVLKATSGTVGGFTLSSTQITSENLVLNSDGIIQTSNFASGQSGWRISSIGNGEAEFQNVKIRGTLSTAVFEKESVNAVGGQLYIANSTALTGSVAISASAATMSVANVGGFVANEILSAKKISGTGFATEYMLVESSSRDFPSSETDFRGKLYVVRGYNSGSTGDSGSLGDTANISQSLEPGQVIVSTGKIGTGFIRLNANPNDTTTPYMDIVERTGSGVYDVELKARLGDLSGLSSGLLYGNASPGFGLFTENVFLQGAITATTGSFTGKVHVGTTDGIVIDGNAKKLYQGVGTHNNINTGFYMDSTGNFSLGDKLVWNGSTLTVTGAINITSGTGFATPDSVSGSFSTTAQLAGVGAGATTSASNAQSAGVGAAVGAQASASAYSVSVQASASAFAADAELSASNYGIGAAASASAVQTNLDSVSGSIATDISASNSTQTTVSASTSARIVTDANNKIIVPSDTPSGNGLFLTANYLGYYNSGWNAFIQNNGNFLFKADNDNLVSFGTSVSGGDGQSTTNFVLKAQNAFLSGSSVNLLTERFFFGSGNQFISGSQGNLKIFSTGNTTLSGSEVTIETPKFFLGKQGSQFVSGSNNLIEISSSKFHLKNDGNVIMNQITASDAKVSGDITANTITANNAGTIANFTIDSNEIKSSNNQLRLKQNGQLTASNYLFNGDGIITGSVTIGTSATILGTLSAGSIATPAGGPPFSAEINSEGYARFVSASIGGFRIDETTISDFTNANLQISSSGVISGSKVLFDGGKIGGWNISGTTLSNGSDIVLDSSNKRISINNSTFGGDGIQLEHISGGGRFYAGDGSDKFIKFDGTDIDIKTDTATISGSSIIIKTNDFFLGKTGAQFISGSNNNIEITSSMFHLDPANNKVAISGSITATTGKIGGMLLENNKLKSQYGDGTVITKTVTVSSGVYHIDGVQQPTLELKVGNTYRFDNSHSSNSGHPFRFATSADGTTYSTNVTVVGSEGNGGTAYVQIVVTASTPSTLYYKCTSHSGMGGQLNIITIGTLELNGVNGQITASDMSMSGTVVTDDIDATGGTIGGFVLTSTAISSSNDNLILKSNGQITASAMSMSGAVVATSGEIGGFRIGTDLDSTSGTLKLKGASGQITASAVSMSGTIVASSGNVGGFIIDSSEVRSSNNNLRLKSNGQITASAMSMSGTVVTDDIDATGGTIGGFTLDAHSLTSTGIEINDSTQTLFISSSAFKVDHSGNVTASNISMSGAVIASSGEIGGFRIGTDLDSTSGTLKLKGASGQITASDALINGNITATTINATGSGVIGGFSIDQTTISSSNSNLILRSSGQITASAAQITGKITAQSGTIGGFNINQVGGGQLRSSSGNFIVSGSAGIIILGGGLGAAANRVIKLDARATTDGKSGDEAIRMSVGNATPANAPFQISAAGSLTSSAADISGKINATSGNIAGFNIETTELTKKSIIPNTRYSLTSSIDLREPDVDSVTGPRILLRSNSTASSTHYEEFFQEIAFDGTSSDPFGFLLQQHDVKRASGTTRSKIQTYPNQSTFALTTSSGSKVSINNFSVQADVTSEGTDTTDEGKGARFYLGGFTRQINQYRQRPLTGVAGYTNGQGILFQVSSSGGTVASTGKDMAHNKAFMFVGVNTGSHFAFDGHNQSVEISGSNINIDSATTTAKISGSLADKISAGTGSFTSASLGHIVLPASLSGADRPSGIRQNGQALQIGDIFNEDGTVELFAFGGKRFDVGDGEVNVTGLLNATDVTITDDLKVNDFARIDALRVGVTNTDPGDGNLYVEGDINANGNIVGDGSTNISGINSGSFKHGVISTTSNANPATLRLESTDGTIDIDDVFGKIDWTARGEDTDVQEVIGRIHVEARSGTWNEGDKPARMSFQVSDNTTPDLTEIFHIQFDDSNPSMTVNEELKVAKALSVGGITPSATTGRIDAANDVVAFSSSDIRFKENVTPIQDALFKVQQLQGVEFDWKKLTKEEKKTLHSNEGHDVGVIAQEVEKVLPEVVQTRESGYKAVKYEKIVPLLIESIKELTKRVEELENGSS